MKFIPVVCGLVLLCSVACRSDTEPAAYFHPNRPAPASTLGGVPVTSPEQLSRWPEMAPSLQVIETYRFSVSGDDMISPVEDAAGEDFDESTPPGAVFKEPAGAGDDRVLHHTPNPR